MLKDTDEKVMQVDEATDRFRKKKKDKWTNLIIVAICLVIFGAIIFGIIIFNKAYKADQAEEAASRYKVTGTVQGIYVKKEAEIPDGIFDFRNTSTSYSIKVDGKLYENVMPSFLTGIEVGKTITIEGDRDGVNSIEFEDNKIKNEN